MSDRILFTFASMLLSISKVQPKRCNFFSIYLFL